MIIGKCFKTSEENGARIYSSLMDENNGFEHPRDFLLKTIVKGLGLRQIEFTDGVVEESFCITCNGKLGYEKFMLGDYGEIEALRSECKPCRDNALLDCEAIKKEQEYIVKQCKCSGRQNKKIKHTGIEVGWSDILDGFEFQKQFLDYAERILDGKEELGAYVFGGSGTGKTFLAKLLNNELVESMRDVVFFKAVDLAMVLRTVSMANRRDEDVMGKIINDLRSVDVLIVDDLGTQKNTDFVKEIMFSIFDTRYDNRKKTVITTNLTADDIGDDRLASRFADAGWMRKFNFKKHDLRQLKFNQKNL